MPKVSALTKKSPRAYPLPLEGTAAVETVILNRILHTGLLLRRTYKTPEFKA